MNEAHIGRAAIGGSTGGTIRDASDHAAIFGAADWLCLADTPTFAIMALLNSVGGTPDILCSATDASSPSGMAAMYLLMSAFHSAPWLKLISAGRGVVRRS